ncbi:MAG: hypothetical protein H0T88_03720 [Lysobacter sp.]|nr:hypothetical protein [Lysobacter sp.]
MTIAGADIEQALAVQRSGQGEYEGWLHALGDRTGRRVTPAGLHLRGNDGSGHVAQACIQGLAR